MKLSNQEIYDIVSLNNTNNIFEDLYIPAKANFFIQKNLRILTAAAKEIEEARLEIAKHYGVLNEENDGYTIPQDKQALAIQELQDLFSIEQDIELKTFSIEDLNNIEFTTTQMRVLMIMIED